MKFQKTVLILMVIALILSGSLFAKKEKPVVQMAILLDTSGSMDGLIEQAKMQLWKIVNEMATAKKGGKIPQLEVALYEYGKSSISRAQGYMRKIVPLSSDLDKLSEELFKLRTNGGSEFCGMVINRSVKELEWKPGSKDYKVIFIAGNEPFTQGSVNYKDSCKLAISQGIIVNTIFCGNYNTGINTNWKDGADLADGKYMNIDQNKKIAHITAPQDKNIIKLGKLLNKTYISYGKGGALKKARQEKQDKNAAALSPSVMVQRSAAKASKQYSNVGWDLVDAEESGKLKVEELKEEELPAEMKKLDKEGRKAYIKKKSDERKKIQAQIKELKKKRDKYVKEKRKEISKDETLDSAMIGAIREQAKKKKYKFEKK
ncbi:MAG: VWA domain-containing protein [Acidobacteriota bacterium]